MTGTPSGRFVVACLAGMVTIAVAGAGALLYGAMFAGFYAANLGPATGVMKDPPEHGLRAES